jgi:hypothetical protein
LLSGAASRVKSGDAAAAVALLVVVVDDGKDGHASGRREFIVPKLVCGFVVQVVSPQRLQGARSSCSSFGGMAAKRAIGLVAVGRGRAWEENFAAVSYPRLLSQSFFLVYLMLSKADLSEIFLGLIGQLNARRRLARKCGSSLFACRRRLADCTE